MDLRRIYMHKDSFFFNRNYKIVRCVSLIVNILIVIYEYKVLHILIMLMSCGRFSKEQMLDCGIEFAHLIH